MSDRTPEIGVLAPIVLVAVLAENSDKIAARFSRYWDFLIAPTIYAGLTLIFWGAVIALGGFAIWNIGKAIFDYCRTHRIISIGDYATLLNDIADLQKSLDSAENSYSRTSNAAWTLRAEVDKLKEELKKATAKPESVIDTIVKDVVGEGDLLDSNY